MSPSQQLVTENLRISSINIREISIMKRLMWYVSCCLMPLFGASATYANPEVTPSTNTVIGTAASSGRLSSTDYHQSLLATPTVASDILAQSPPPSPTNPSTPTAPPAPTDTPSTPPSTTTPATPNGADGKDVQEQLNKIKETPVSDSGYQPKSSPAFAIFNPVGFGADKNLVFFSLDYQSCTRGPTCVSDGGAGIGIGLGDATNSIGAEVSYALNSFGSSAAFGSGAFSGKIHKRVAEDTAVAIGWNQFAKINFGAGRNGSSPSDYPNNSYYLVGTKIFRTVDDINQPFSRVALTAGVGSGVFVPYDTNNQSLDRGGIGVFGSVGVRVARPISAVVEWTGQDLAAGISIAPFDNFPLVITPALRDITGIPGQSARFVIGASAAFNF
jgi:hypothetical protein